MLLDASVFSRAVIGGYDIKKYQVKESSEVIVGRLTGLYGDILKYANPKVIHAPSRFDDNTLIREVEGKNVYKTFEVPAGITFENLIKELSKTGYFPALFPLYLKGTVGGFIALNGSGFGSYKFGFVKNSKTVHKLIDNKVARILGVKYPEVLEIETESKFAWSAIIYNSGEVKYFVPSIYAKILNVEPVKIRSTQDVIDEIERNIMSVFRRDYVPIILKIPFEKSVEINIDVQLGYIINYNSPAKFKVLIGKIEESRLEELFEYLRKNRDVTPFPYLKDYEEFHRAILDNFKKYNVKIREKGIDKNIFIDATKCINCSLCIDNCLSYKTTNNIIFSALGRINRLLTSDNVFEACFGCTACEQACPVGISISKITEVLPTISSVKEKYDIEMSELPRSIYELEKILDNKYKNKPVFLLFVGCASKYDPLSVEGFMNYLLTHGDKISMELSPRIKVINGICCGFDAFLSADYERAKKQVERINELKAENNAIGIYFLCPEGLYVYNKFSNTKGVFAYDVIKGELKDKEVHLGCWARKLGYDSKFNECAGLFLTTYKGNPLRVEKKDFLTVCPFSTWKFGTVSVYSAVSEKTKFEEISRESQFDESLIFNLLIISVKEALNKCADEIAEKVIMWKLGGEQYFTLLSIPIISKYIGLELTRNLNSTSSVKQFFNEISQNKLLFNQKVSTYTDYLIHYNFDSEIDGLVKSILNSPKLDYSARDIVNNTNFKQALRTALQRAINQSLIQNSIMNILYI